MKYWAHTLPTAGPYRLTRRFRPELPTPRGSVPQRTTIRSRPRRCVRGGHPRVYLTVPACHLHQVIDPVLDTRSDGTCPCGTRRQVAILAQLRRRPRPRPALPGGIADSSARATARRYTPCFPAVLRIESASRSLSRLTAQTTPLRNPLPGRPDPRSMSAGSSAADRTHWGQFLGRRSGARLDRCSYPTLQPPVDGPPPSGMRAKPQARRHGDRLAPESPLSVRPAPHGYSVRRRGMRGKLDGGWELPLHTCA